jgi:hypothetical protein
MEDLDHKFNTKIDELSQDITSICLEIKGELQDRIADTEAKAVVHDQRLTDVENAV